MKITEIIPSELSGFCDVETGECVIVDTGIPAGAALDDSSPGPGPGIGGDEGSRPTSATRFDRDR